MSKIKIVETHIENDTRDQIPTLVFTDENGIEWVHEEQACRHGGFITSLVKKSESWYWATDRIPNNPIPTRHHIDIEDSGIEVN